MLSVWLVIVMPPAPPLVSSLARSVALVSLTVVKVPAFTVPAPKSATTIAVAAAAATLIPFICISPNGSGSAIFRPLRSAARPFRNGSSNALSNHAIVVEVKVKITEK